MCQSRRCSKGESRLAEQAVKMVDDNRAAKIVDALQRQKELPRRLRPRFMAEARET